MKLYSSHLRSALSLMLVVTLVLLSGIHASSVAVAQSQPVADTGFLPATDGFAFQNYGNETGYSNLTPADVRHLFGDQVCAELKSDNCVLTPAGEEWMNKVNKDMGGGHCDGLATLSSMFYTKKEDLNNYGASQTIALSVDGNLKLQREIAYWWATQTTLPAATSEIKLPPADLLKKYIDDTTNKTEFYTVGLYQPDGSQGHSITPYAVQDKGNGLFWLMVYDNNYPKEERHIEIDTNANTWKYSTASDPSQAANDYAGNATTLSLTLTPNSSRLQPQTCPFCQTPAAKISGLALIAPQYNEIWLNDNESANSNVHLLISNDQGQKLGYDKGKLVNTIPGATFVRLTNNGLWQDKIEPLYLVPSNMPFTLTIDGSQLTKEETSSVAMIGAGYDLAADNITLQAGESDIMSFSPDGKKLTYKPSGTESPDFSVGLQHTTTDYEFDIKGFEVDKGATVNIDLEYDKGQLALHTEGNTNPSTYALTVNRITDTEEQTFEHSGIPLSPGATAYIDFGKWDGKSDINIEMDSKSNGTIDQTVDESNQPK